MEQRIFNSYESANRFFIDARNLRQSIRCHRPFLWT